MLIEILQGRTTPGIDAEPGWTQWSITIGLTFSTSIEEAVSMLQQKGVKFQGRITQDNAGKIAYFEDPDGNLLYCVGNRRLGAAFNQ